MNDNYRRMTKVFRARLAALGRLEDEGLVQELQHPWKCAMYLDRAMERGDDALRMAVRLVITALLLIEEPRIVEHGQNEGSEIVT